MMHIVICVKQVPDTKDVRIDPETHTLIRQGVESIINPFDLHAVEAALRLKDVAGAKTTVITMGPPQAEEVLREAISRGVDEGILLSDSAFAGADSWATASTLAAAIRRIGDVDLIICGKQAIDGDTAQVGPALASLLNIPYATYVKEIEILENRGLRISRRTDDGIEVWKLPLPALVTVIKEIGEPRVPSLRFKMKARKAAIPVWRANDINLAPEEVGLRGSFTRVIRVFSPPRRGKRIFLDGSVEEQAEQLYQYLKKMKVPGI